MLQRMVEPRRAERRVDQRRRIARPVASDRRSGTERRARERRTAH